MTEHKRILTEVHGSYGEINFDYMKEILGAFRLYWYDSVLNVDSVYGIETLEESKVRAQRVKSIDRELFLQDVSSHDGYVVRLGTSRGLVDKGRFTLREKEVDVLLAVDSMSLAATKNMRHAVIIGGDLDHRPIAEGLMQLGVYVTVYGHKRSPQEIRYGADSYRPLDYDFFYEISDQDWRAKNKGVYGQSLYTSESNPLVEACKGQDLEIEIVYLHQRVFQGTIRYTNGKYENFHCEDRSTLRRYFNHRFDNLEWIESKLHF